MALGLVLPGLLPGCGSKQSPVEQAAANPPVQQQPGTSSEGETLSQTPPVPARPGDGFEDVTEKAGIKFVNQYCDTRIANILESNGAGCAILDYDRDGLMDIYLVNSGPLEGVTHHAPGTKREPNRLYRNRGDGTFEDVTAKAGVGGSGFGTAAVSADYDNDGFPDLYVVNVGRNILFHNRGNGTFEDVTEKAGVGDKGPGMGATFLDVDGDGRLDLFVANYLTFNPNYSLYFNPDAYPGPLSYKPEANVLYHQKPDGTFEDISERSGVRLLTHRAMSVSAFDVDLDGDTDLYISNDATPNTLLLNDGKGHFEEKGVQAGVAFNALGEAAGSMAAAVGDCNGDGWPDILVTRLGYGSLYMGGPTKVFSDRMMASGLGGITAEYVGWGGGFVDFDNDTDLDIIIANGDAHHLVGWESLLIENTGAGSFVNSREKGGAVFEARIRARGFASLDFNNDGRVDFLMTTMGDRPFLVQNRVTNGNHWLTFALEGTKCNRDGFGARITVGVGGKKFTTEARCVTGFLSSSDPRVHFGLGQATAVESVEVKWPSGQVQKVENVGVDHVVKVKEP